MPSSEERQTRSLMDIAGEARKVRMILEALLENNTILTRAVKADIEAHAFKPIDPRGLKPRFDLDMLVVVYDERHVRDGWRGKIVDLSSLSATVLLEDGVKLHLNGNQMLPLDEKPAHMCGGPEYCVVCRDEETIKDANQLEIPTLVDDAKIGPSPEPSESYEIHQDGKKILEKFIPVEGRLYPSEWRHNLGIDKIRVMKPDSPTLARNENRPMTQEQFENYNHAAYAAGVIMNEEDAEGTPDDLGRLKPYEWRQKFDMPQIDPGRGQAHAFDENRLMTEEAFRIYNAGLHQSGTEHHKGDF